MQRLRGGVVSLLLLIPIGLAAHWVIFARSKPVEDVAVYTDLAPESPTYWTERVNQDFEAIQSKNLPPKEEHSLLLTRLAKTLSAATSVSEGFARSVAVSDTAIAIFRHDFDINVDEYLEATGETPLAISMKAKVLIAYAMMLLRINNQVAAGVAMNNYDRIVKQADLKLDTAPNEWAFCGAAKYFSFTRDLNSLDELFRLNLKYTPRIADNNLRMKAYRIIATEQARIGRDRDAMETAALINTPVELARAFQGIIINVARPTTPDLSEPSVFIPKSVGPWEQISVTNQENAKRIINDVIRVITSKEVVTEQIETLSRLACSRMVCDPHLYDLFKGCVLESRALTDTIKRPILAKLQNPESDAMRKSLNMPLLAHKKSSDPALDDWSSSFGELSVDVGAFDPNVIKGIVNMTWVGIRINIAQSYLLLDRRLDAGRALQQAYSIAQTLTDTQDRIELLLEIVSLQLNAGDLAGAQATFQAIGLPQRIDGKAAWSVPPKEESGTDVPSNTNLEPGSAFVETTIARLARLRIFARCFEDAKFLIGYLQPGIAKDDEYFFLATELIRSQRFKDATGVVVNMNKGPRQTTLLHRLAVSKDGSETDYQALGLTIPQDGVPDKELAQTAQYMLQYGLYAPAVAAAERISVAEDRDQMLRRIVRDIVIFCNAYGDMDADHVKTRKHLLGIALETVEKIKTPQIFAETMELLLLVAVPFAKSVEEQDSLQPLFLKGFDRCREIPSTVVAKAEILANLVASNIRLYAASKRRPPRWPLMNREADATQIDDVRKILGEAIEIVNASEDVSASAQALISIARCLGMIGNKTKARELLDHVVEIAVTLNDKQQSTSLLLAVLPVMQSLEYFEAVRTVYQVAENLIGDVNGDILNSREFRAILELKSRDTELDRLARSQLGFDYTTEAITTTGRINDANTRDRLFRIAAYRYIDKDDLSEAEAIVRKITESRRAPILRNVMFVRHQRDMKALKTP